MIKTIAGAGVSALYVTLRVPDPAALTAEATLREMGLGSLARLQRGRVWIKRGGEEFGATTETWLNPNKERALFWDAVHGIGEDRSREAWVLTRERGSSPETRALRSFQERAARMPAELLSCGAWRVVSERDGEARELAGRLTVVRSACEGLLVNPHSQVYEICEPPHSIEEWQQRVATLHEEAL
jgi:hypothetical protein